MPRILAGTLAVSHAAFGLNYLVRPHEARTSWIGRAAKRPGTQVMVRAQGGRDVALGGGALRALARADARELQAWVAALTFADLVDVGATYCARDALPERRARMVLVLAGASTLVGTAALATLARAGAERPPAGEAP
ncbi:hypothetical protein DVA67_028100 [Solirubrobacter sp. CPCC 204708]|uniref:Uncharacterized protein n=1 Tax=Solirubrobacter deserti TaxID=2282478 RepID=A0ABT4RS23_9ACTN|nr:hypothetical protein [Solirubrobacter deserti]MBE2319860.1 hypothetical protein [Solirubrobacter deserti]MDA0141393.1 hypothetical protein [Solirubrobacter deserti]